MKKYEVHFQFVDTSNCVWKNKKHLINVDIYNKLVYSLISLDILCEIKQTYKKNYIRLVVDESQYYYIMDLIDNCR